MSSILKALKKLEEENLARSGAPPRIDSEILRQDAPPPRSSGTSIALLAVTLFACGAGATYFYLKQPAAPPKNAGGTVSPGTAVSPPPAPFAARETAPPVERITPEPIVAAPPEPRDKRQRPAAPPPGTSDQAAGQARAADPVPRPAPRNTPTPAQLPGQARPPAATPALRVNGIAYQDGADSVAVVNGTPVSRGGMIEGVRVVEIRRDRVFFSSDGERFEIQLGRSNR